MDGDAALPTERSEVMTLHVTVPDDLKEAVVARAKLQGVTISQYVIGVLETELMRAKFSGRPSEIDETT
jgi:predicted HicB family RNase H-like nuclease